jgi:hypothetical protein
VSPRLIKTTGDALEFVEGVVSGLDLDPADADAVKAIMFSFARRLRPDLNITETDDGDITVVTSEALA